MRLAPILLSALLVLEDPQRPIRPELREQMAKPQVATVPAPALLGERMWDPKKSVKASVRLSGDHSKSTGPGSTNGSGAGAPFL